MAIYLKFLLFYETTETKLMKYIKSLSDLEERVQSDLEIMNYPRKEWVHSYQNDNDHIYDVLIVGGGQSGLAIYFALWSEHIRNIAIVDENPKNQEGPWLTFARMETLRTPKHITGPDYGFASLTPHAWYVARYGQKAWDELKFIDRKDWAEYLQWFRKVLNIPVENDVKVEALSWQVQKNCFLAPTIQNGQRKNIYARKVILANGIDGSGQWHVPEFISQHIPKEYYFHTREPILFEKFRNKRIGILGAGASAFDNAICCLEQGAKVDLFYRRHQPVKVNPYRWAEFTGFLAHHADLNDEQKWQFIAKITEIGQLPPKSTYFKALGFDQFRMHSGCAWHKAVFKNESQILVKTDQGDFEFDYLLIGTGFRTDLSLRPELKNFCDKIALWSDRFHPHEKLSFHADLLRHPYLKDGFQFCEKTPGSAHYLNSLFSYNFGCIVSLGLGGASLSGMKYSVRRLVKEVCKQFYVEDVTYYYDQLCSYDTPEFE